jgi:hypothetical protein
MLNKATGELVERRLDHESGEGATGRRNYSRNQCGEGLHVTKTGFHIGCYFSVA